MNAKNHQLNEKQPFNLISEIFGRNRVESGICSPAHTRSFLRMIIGMISIFWERSRSTVERD